MTSLKIVNVTSAYLWNCPPVDIAGDEETLNKKKVAQGQDGKVPDQVRTYEPFLLQAGDICHLDCRCVNDGHVSTASRQKRTY